MANAAQCSLKVDPAVDVQADVDSELAVASHTDIVPQTAEDWAEVLFQMIPNCVASTRGYSGPVGLVADVQEYVPLLGRVYWLALQAKYNRQPSLDSRKATFHMEPTIPKNGAAALGALAATTRSQVAKWLMREPGHVVHVEEGLARMKVTPSAATSSTAELVQAVTSSSGKKARQAAGLLLADGKKIGELAILFRQGEVSPRMVEGILKVAISPFVTESNARVLIQAAYFSANKKVQEAGRKGLEAWAKRKGIGVDAAVQQIS